MLSLKSFVPQTLLGRSLLILVLLVKPSGLFGRPDVVKV